MDIENSPANAGQERALGSSTPLGKRAYSSPTFRKAGNLYEVTLGGSPGSGDSVNTATTSVPSGGKRGSRPPFPHP